MKVKVINNVSYQTFPIVDGMIEYNDEDLKKIGITKQFDAYGNIIDYVNYSERIAELKQKLKDTDYQAIKHFEGYLTDYEYEPIKTQRQAWRDEINELEKLV